MVGAHKSDSNSSSNLTIPREHELGILSRGLSIFIHISLDLQFLHCIVDRRADGALHAAEI